MDLLFAEATFPHLFSSAFPVSLSLGWCSFRGSGQNLDLRSRGAVHLPAFLEQFLARQVAISMDGRGRSLENGFVERLLRSVKCEKLCPGEFRSGFAFFQTLDYATPADYYFACPHMGARPETRAIFRYRARTSLVRRTGKTVLRLSRY